MARMFQRGSRWWGDFRDFRSEGGDREPLVPPGQTRGTEDKRLAAQLYAARLKELEGVRDNVARGRPAGATLGDFAREHVAAKRQAGQVSAEHLRETAVYLERAVQYFGDRRRLETIGVEEVERWIAALRARRVKNRPAAGGLSEGTIRHHLNALSNLYRRAQARTLVLAGYNPVAALLEKPVGRRAEAAWLEVPDAALLLEVARRLPPLTHNNPRQLHFTYPLLATLLLTGGRLDEVLGLELDDVSLERRTVTFRPNRWRGIKTERSGVKVRTVPLWPQLEEILREYLRGPHRPTGELLFPAPGTGPEAKLGDPQKSIDRVAIAAGFREPVLDPLTQQQRKDAKERLLWRGTIRSKMFRHTYCAARLQTTDQGAPVSVWTVAQELGHHSEAMICAVYGHLGQVRHRSAVVEYRVEQHQEQLRERLAALQVTAQ